MSNIEFEIDNTYNPPQYAVLFDCDSGDLFCLGYLTSTVGDGYVFDPIPSSFRAQELHVVADKLDELNKGCDNE